MRTAGTLDERGELWLQCPESMCDDHRSPSEAVHYSINIHTGLHHCHRCGYGGVLDFQEYLELVGDFVIADLHTPAATEKAWPKLLEGQAIRRFSQLTRFHTNDDWDGFQSRLANGQVVGVHLRKPGEALSYGQRALGYARAGPLVSLAEPIRLVEGPYDVVAEFDVCTFGLPSTRQLRELIGYPLILCPDGDIWTKRELFGRYWATMRKGLKMGLHIIGAEYLPDGLDPDEVPVRQRQQVHPDKLRGYLTYKTKWRFL